MKHQLDVVTLNHLFFFALFLALTLQAQAQFFTLVVDTSTPVPGGLSGETFGVFLDEDLAPPKVSDRCIAFAAQGLLGSWGIYLLKDGVIEVVANTNTRLPDGAPGERFRDFEESFALDGCDVVFDGIGNGGFAINALGPIETRGIYLKRDDAPLQKVVDHKTLGPNGIFTDFESPLIAEDGVVFWATSQGNCRTHEGGGNNGSLFRYSSHGIKTIAEPCGDTPVPGGLPGETFLEIGQVPSLEAGRLAFWGRADLGTRGIYSLVDGELQVVADSSTPIPGGHGAVFSGFLPVAPISGEDAVFLGVGPEPSPPFTHVGLYRASPNNITNVIDLLNLPPLPGWKSGDTISFTEDDFPGFWFHRNIVTLGVSGTINPATIFLLERTGISSLIAAGDVLEGKVVRELSRFAHHSAQQKVQRIVFIVGFEDESSAIYLAESAKDSLP